MSVCNSFHAQRSDTFDLNLRDIIVHFDKGFVVAFLPFSYGSFKLVKDCVILKEIILISSSVHCAHLYSDVVK